MAQRVEKIISHLRPVECSGETDYTAQLNSLLREEGIRVTLPLTKEFLEVLTPDALRLLATLHRKFDERRRELLFKRELRQFAINSGELPDFLPETKFVRDGHWKAASVPADLQDRRVEITGPVDRKMVINALNSGANCFMADFEDSNSPVFSNNVNGQINLRDANRGTITFTNPDGKKKYQLNKKTATLLVRPRGWHLVECGVEVDGRPVPAGIFDFAIYFYNNAKTLLAKGSGPYFYLPKMESHLEARLWNDVFNVAQDYCGVPRGSIRATVLIETILAAFEMDEIIYELRDHSAGLNCGRWDYIFSYIKKFRNMPNFVLPERGQVGMTVHFMDSYVRLLIKTCHRRGVHAMGGMAAVIPIRNDAKANAAAMEKVKADKLREVKAGHDGTWVAHPALVAVAREVFDEHMKTPNQLHVARDDVHVTAADLLRVPLGTITPDGVKTNLRVAILYVEAWIRGVGCVPINHLMEDAATAEICRGQLWQWVQHGAKTTDGTVITREMVRGLLPVVMEEIQKSVGDAAFQKGRFDVASRLVIDMATDSFPDFLTLVAYDYLN